MMVTNIKNIKNKLDKIKIKVMKKKNFKEIRKILKTTLVVFTVRGKDKSFETCCYDEDSNECGSIWGSYCGMNVRKWGPTCVTLYSYDMLGNKTTGKIKYSDVTGISPKEKINAG